MAQNQNKKLRNLSSLIYFDAIYNILTKAPDYEERSIRRWACKELNLSYLETFKINWAELLVLYYETNLEAIKKNNLIRLAKEDFLDQFISEAEIENDKFARSVAEQEYKKKQVVTKLKEEKQSLIQEQEKVKPKEFNLKFDLKE